MIFLMQEEIGITTEKSIRVYLCCLRMRCLYQFLLTNHLCQLDVVDLLSL